MMRDTRNIRGLTALGNEFERIPAKLRDGPLRRGLEEGARREILPAARAKAAKATGELARGLKVESKVKGSRAIASVKTSGPHSGLARWIEYGTRSHWIAAKNSSALRFLYGGKLAFAKYVKHPGFGPRRFMRSALDARGEAALKITAIWLQRALSSKASILAGYSK